jgi:hypothetical protein
LSIASFASSIERNIASKSLRLSADITASSVDELAVPCRADF